MMRAQLVRERVYNIDKRTGTLQRRRFSADRENSHRMFDV
jgi:hypothetical protein